MASSFRESYKVNKSPIELSNEIQMGLRENKEYESISDSYAEQILNYFLKCYPSVSIEVPKKRKKTMKSINEKSKNKEIDRLSELYVIEGISIEERKELYDLIQNRIYERKELDSKPILKAILCLIEEDIQNVDIDEFLNLTMVPEISSSTKKALLRILMGKLEKSTLPDKKEKMQSLDEKYGMQAQIKSGNAESNIMKYEEVQKLREELEKLELLHDEVGYLKSEDLMGMKIVVINVPSNIQTENEELKELLILRDNEKDRKKKEFYDNKANQEIVKDFIGGLITNKELLENMGVEIIPDSLKHKVKTNGYDAYHVKIRSLQNKQYTLELQMKSEYVENLARGNGKAAHENRPGKKRVIPNTKKIEEFIKTIKYTVPEYTIFVRKKDGYKARKCNMLENIMGYYETMLYPGVEEYDEVVEMVKKVESKEVTK